MQVFRFIFILLLFVWPLDLLAEIKFEFSDGPPEWHKYVKEIYESSPSFNNADSLSRLLINSGFPNAAAKMNNINDTTFYNIKFGDRFYIGDLILTGDINDTINYNKLFEQSTYENLIDSILNIYQNQGFYFTNLLSPVYRAENNRVNISLYLQTGPVVEVSSVEFDGIKRTSNKLLKRYIDISSGDTLNLANVERNWNNLNNVNFIKTIKSPEIIPEPGYNKARVRYFLAELKSLVVEGAGGYSPDDNGSFFGYLDFNLKNYFGGGRTIGLLIDKKEKNRSLQQLLYSQPLFLLGRGEAKFLLRTRDFRDQFYEFSVIGRHQFEIGRNLNAQFNLGWKNLEPSDQNNQAYNVYNAGFGIEMGKVENRFSKVPQFSLGWEIGYYARFYKGAEGDSVSTLSDINDTRNRLKVKASLNLLSSMILYLKADFADLSSSEKPLPVSEKYLFGGLSGLRGYRNDQFSARRLLIIEIEPRFFFSDVSYFYPFLDVAYHEYYYLDEIGNIAKFDDFIGGYGFGFNLKSNDRMFNITFSWGEDSRINQPRLNIILSDSF